MQSSVRVYDRLKALDERLARLRAQRDLLKITLAEVAHLLARLRADTEALRQDDRVRQLLADQGNWLSRAESVISRARLFREDEPSRFWPAVWRRWTFAALTCVAAAMVRHGAPRWAEHEALAKREILCPYVFQRDGERVKSFRGAWSAASVAAGLPGRIPHDLRRSAVRNMNNRGLARSLAMEITGHKTESVYRRYSIHSADDHRAAVASLTGPIARDSGARVGQSARQGQKRDNLHHFGATRKSRKSVSA
jgi:integrase